MVRKIVGDSPEPVQKEYGRELRFLIMKLLEKDPSQRPDVGHILQYSAVTIRVCLGFLSE